MLSLVTDFNTDTPATERLGSLTFNSLSEYAAMVSQFDFTKVDTDVAKNVLDVLGQKASKKIFEAAAGIVDKGLEIASAGMGATGQWYGMAAGVISEKALDWLEVAFENKMGWEELDRMGVGEWVAIDEGFTSRRLMGPEFDFDPITLEEMEVDDVSRELKKKDKLARQIHLGNTRGPASAGYREVFDVQTGTVRNVPVQSLRKLPPDERARISADPM